MPVITKKARFEILDKVHKRTLQNFESIHREDDSREAAGFLEAIEKL